MKLDQRKVLIFRTGCDVKKWRNSALYRYWNSGSSFKVIGTNCGCQIRVPKVTTFPLLPRQFFLFPSPSEEKIGELQKSFLREIPVHFNNYLGSSFSRERRVSTKNSTYFQCWRLNSEIVSVYASTVSFQNLKIWSLNTGHRWMVHFLHFAWRKVFQLQKLENCTIIHFWLIERILRDFVKKKSFLIVSSSRFAPARISTILEGFCLFWGLKLFRTEPQWLK